MCVVQIDFNFINELVVQLGSLINLRGTTAFSNKFVWYNGNRFNPGQILTRCATSPEILDKNSQDAPHPRKSWTKPFKMRPTAGNSGQNQKRCAPSPEIPEKSRKKPHKKTLFLLVVVGWLVVGSDKRAEAPCGGKYFNM